MDEDRLLACGGGATIPVLCVRSATELLGDPGGGLIIGAR